MEGLGLDFWKGKKVLITGHTGFKGSWLTLMLLNRGAKVTGYSLPAPSSPSMFELCNIEKEIDHNIVQDVNSLRELKKAVKGQEIVFHLAAQALVLDSYKNPAYNYQTNIMGTVNVLEACRHEGIQAIVCVTSDKCYENKEWFWGYRENDNLGGYDPYSSSKACAEIVASSYRTSYSLSVATCRAGNVIGGGDWGNYRLIPNIVRSAENKEIMTLRKPDATRPWQHVLDVLTGYINVAERLYKDKSFAQAWNFAPTNTIDVPVKDLVEKFNKFIDFDYEIIESENDPHEARNLKLDCFKAINLLKWNCNLSVDESVALTASWYISYMSKKDLLSKSLKQIEGYNESFLR